MTAIATRVQKGEVQRIVFVVYAAATVVERWVFDVQGFPTDGWGTVEDEDEATSAALAAQNLGEDGVNWTDVQEALRGALRRIAYAAESRQKLPSGCTFTLAVELRDGAPAPIGVSESHSHSFTCGRAYCRRSIHRHGSQHSQTSSRPHKPVRQVKGPRSVARAQHLYDQCKLDRCSSNAGWKTVSRSRAKFNQVKMQVKVVVCSCQSIVIFGISKMSLTP